MSAFRRYALHYCRGAFASAFNAGNLALNAILGHAGAAVVMPATIPPPAIKEAAAIWAGAAVVGTVRYFVANPIPVAVLPAPVLAPVTLTAQVP